METLGTIAIPTWLLSGAEARDLVAKLRGVVAESPDHEDAAADAALLAMADRIELLCGNNG